MSKNKQEKTTLLTEAIRNDQQDVVLKLISGELTKEDMQYALKYAVEKGYKDLAKNLVDMGADPNFKDEYGYSLLLNAARIGNINALNTLVQIGADLNLQSSTLNPLNFAISKGHTDFAEALIDSGADVNKPDGIKDTPLCVAIYHNDISIFRKLINNVKDVNIHDSAGNTPLILAIQKQNTEMVRTLIAKGADVNLPDDRGNIPLVLAARNANTAIVELLLKQPKIEQEAINEALKAKLEQKKEGRYSFILNAENNNKLIGHLIKAGATTIIDDKLLQSDFLLKELVTKYKQELSDPELKSLRSMKDGISKFDGLDQKFDLAKKKEQFISKIKDMELSAVKSGMNETISSWQDGFSSWNKSNYNWKQKELLKNLGLDIEGLNDTQIEKLTKTAKKIINKGERENLNPQVVKEKLAEELIIKVEMMKIRNKHQSEKSEDRSFADRATPSKTTQGKSR